MKLKCKICNKPIRGTVKINTYNKKVGNKLVSVVDHYCEECFKKMNKERALNEHTKEKRSN